MIAIETERGSQSPATLPTAADLRQELAVAGQFHPPGKHVALVPPGKILEVDCRIIWHGAVRTFWKLD